MIDPQNLSLSDHADKLARARRSALRGWCFQVGRIAYHLPGNRPGTATRLACDFAHEAEVFLGNCAVVSGRLQAPSLSGARISDEDELFLRWAEVECALCSVGIGTIELMQLMEGEPLPDRIARRLRRHTKASASHRIVPE